MVVFKIGDTIPYWNTLPIYLFEYITLTSMNLAGN